MTRRLSASLALSVCLSLATQPVFADVFHILGPRATGMGGAFVAMAEGPIAQYWNPAGLAQEATASKWGIQLPVGARGEFTGGILKDANKLGDLADKFKRIQAAQTSGTAGAMDADEIAAFYEGVAAIQGMNEPGKGVLASIEGGANIKVGGWAVSVNNYTSAGASPFVDTKNIGLGASGSLIGVNFGNSATYCGGSCTGAPANSTNQQSAATIQASLSSQFSALDSLSGGALTAAGINSGNIGNVIVNMAVQNGASVQQIADAAAAISANASAAAPIINNAAAGNPYTNNTSNLTVRGGSFTELALSHGRKLPVVPGLKVGANIKLIKGDIGYARFDVLNKESGSTDAFDDFLDDSKSSVQPALDLGVLWHLKDVVPVLPFKPRVGIVARNINNPKFSQPDLAKRNGEASKYSLNGQMRGGVAISPLNWWHISMDADLTNNNTPVEGFQSRMIALGTEINVVNKSWLNLPLRCGITKNISTSDSKPALTAGFGLNFLHFIFDVGASVSTERTKVEDNDEVPSNASVAAQLSFMF